MILTSVLEFLRILIAFGLVFILFPLAAEGYLLQQRPEVPARTTIEWAPLMLRAFIKAAFAAEILCIVLGQVKLCLPGLIFSASLVACLAGFFATPEARDELDEDVPGIWQPLFSFLDRFRLGSSPSNCISEQYIQPRWSAEFKAFTAAAIVLFFVQAGASMQQVHFDHNETYTRAVSLGTLTQGQAWKTDASVAFLAPLVCFSGVGAASVIRFTGPILTTVFGLVLALCIWRLWRSTVAALLALVALICFSAWVGRDASELLPQSIALLFWTTAAAVWPYSKRDALLGGLMGIMIEPTQWVIPTLALGLISTSMTLARWRSTWPLKRVIAMIATVIIGSTVILWGAVRHPVREFQYEAAARSCERIAHQFRPKEWLVVSPFQELAYTYGRGWHLELSEFVSSFTVDQVSHHEFSFPYLSPHVFFFVERRPIRLGAQPGTRSVVWRYAPVDSQDWSSYLYGDPLGRAALEFSAAELLNAYGHAHHDLSVFYEDDNLIVYHLVRKTSGA